jgi:DNA-directed RNA polymerase subunit RPC12/RpoP
MPNTSVSGRSIQKSKEVFMNRKKCPECGSTTALRKYIYGMPDGPVDESKYLIGGCCITGNDPTYECIDCGHQIFKKPKGIIL